MPPKINRILIPCIIFILISLGNPTISSGQAPETNTFIPIILNNPSERAQNNKLYLPIISYDPSSWIGPYGGTIITAVIDPSDTQVVYAGSFGSGVFKSEDGGDSWHAVNQGLTNLYIYSLAIDPTQPSTLYAGTYHSQVYKSQDGGNSWTWSGSGIQDQAVVYSLAVDPETSSNVYASTRGISNNGFEPWNGVVYKSSDGGQSWTPSLTDVGGIGVKDWVYSLAINPNSPNQLFAATHENGPFRSDDYGSTWHTIHDGINDPSGRAIVISPQAEFSSILYHGVWHFDSVYKSVNSGDLWTGANNGIPQEMVYSMAIDPNSPDSVFLATFSHGLLRTSDGGDSWQNTGLADQIYTVIINPKLTNIMFAGTSGNGLFRSADYGSSWQRSDTGINNAIVTSVVHSPTDPDKIYASLYGAGVFQTANRGQSWEEENAGLGDKLVHDLVMDPAHPGRLYALTDSGGLFQNDLNTGKGWISIVGGLPLTQTALPAFTVDHPFATLEMQEAFASPQTTLSTDQATNVNLLRMVYAPSDLQIAYLGTRGWGVYRSSNGGLNWLPAGLGEETILSLAVDLTDPEIVYAATETPGSLKFSTDGGISWNNADLPVSFYSLTASPSEPGVVYAGTSSGMYRYQSGNWLALGLSEQSVTAITLDPARPGLIVAGTTSGAYYSKNDGMSWGYVSNQLNGHTIQSIYFDQSIPDMFYFSTKTHGIFLTSIRF